MDLPNICEDGEDETGWTGKETAARIQNDRVTLARLEQRALRSKKTWDLRRGCQNKCSEE